MHRRTFVGRFVTVAAILPIVGLAGCGTKSGPPATAGSGSSTTTSTKLTIAAASDLKFALDDLLVDFREQEPGLNVQASYGSSGHFFQQLQYGAPFDLFLSADVDYIRRLDGLGLTLPDGTFDYAEGRIVVWVRNESQLDVAGDGTAALTDPAVKKIAIANPQHAPYGRAAMAALKHFGLDEPLADKLVRGENIAQAAQFVESGAADVGIIALSLAAAPAMKDKGRYAEIPVAAYPRLEQAGAILKSTPNRAAAERLRALLTGPAGRGKLRQYGFVVPGE